jgi:S1-C subfamily serine protease
VSTGSGILSAMLIADAASAEMVGRYWGIRMTVMMGSVFKRIILVAAIPIIVASCQTGTGEPLNDEDSCLVYTVITNGSIKWKYSTGNHRNVTLKDCIQWLELDQPGGYERIPLRRIRAEIKWTEHLILNSYENTDRNKNFRRKLAKQKRRELALQQIGQAKENRKPAVTAKKAEKDKERKAALQRANQLERDRLARIELARKEDVERKRIEVERKRKIAANKKPASPPTSSTSGSGFFVSKLGHVVTNQHVVGECRSITVGDNAKKQVAAEIVETDKRNDLALLKISSTTMASAETKSLIRKLGIRVASRNVPLSSDGLLRSEDVELGERVMVSGYPYGEIFSDTIKVTGGMVSATRGMGDDSGQFQIDAAVQPGNSGGPIYDGNGNIVGVVVSQLNKLKVAKVIGSLPENVNFGIKASTVRQFLTSAGLPTKWSNQSEPVSSKNLAKIAKNQTLMVVCNR